MGTFARVAFGLGLLGLLQVSGCNACKDFDPEKYTYTAANGKDTKNKPEGDVGNWFIIAVQCQPQEKQAVLDAVSQAVTAGGGSASEYGSKDATADARHYRDFGRSVVYKGSVQIGFKTKLTLPDTFSGREDMALDWRGLPGQPQRLLKLNNFGKDGSAAPNYPTLVKQGKVWLLDVPKVYGGDNNPVQVISGMLTEREEGGRCFAGSLPFALVSNGKEITPVGHDQRDDEINADPQELVLIQVSKYKGEYRELMCKLLSKEVVAKPTDTTGVEFDLKLATLWLTGRTSIATNTTSITVSAEWTNEEGTYKDGAATIEPAVFSNNLKNKEGFDKGKHEPGDYYIDVTVDAANKRVKATCYAVLDVAKIPDEAKLTVPITAYDSKTEKALTKTAQIQKK